jgi:hypothetical protein
MNGIHTKRVALLIFTFFFFTFIYARRGHALLICYLCLTSRFPFPACHRHLSFYRCSEFRFWVFLLLAAFATYYLLKCFVFFVFDHQFLHEHVLHAHIHLFLHKAFYEFNCCKLRFVVTAKQELQILFICGRDLSEAAVFLG